MQSYVNAKIKIISENSKRAADKLTPTSQSTVPTPQGSCSINTFGEERATTEPQMKIKKVSAVIFPLLSLSIMQ